MDFFSILYRICSFQFQYRGAYKYNTVRILSPLYAENKVKQMCSPEYDRLRFEKEDRRKVIRYHCLELMDMVEKRYPGRYGGQSPDLYPCSVLS